MMILEQETIRNRVDIDESLFEEIAAGDMSSLTSLYHKTDKAVFGFALSILKNRHDAEDVMQDTYIQIMKYSKNYKAEGKPMAFILTIVKNLSLDKLRRNQKTPENLDDHLELAGEDEYEQLENRIMLDTLLNSLSDEERQIVVLHAQTGLKHKEIAEIFNMNISTVLSKYKRAIKKLQKAHMVLEITNKMQNKERNITDNSSVKGGN